MGHAWFSPHLGLVLPDTNAKLVLNHQCCFRLARKLFNVDFSTVDSSTSQFIILSDQLIHFMCSPTHLNVVSGFQCDVKTHHRQQVLLSFRPYLLRELMNFSLARLLTSFKVPSSGLLHLLTPVAGVCFPRKETGGVPCGW